MNTSPHMAYSALSFMSLAQSPMLCFVYPLVWVLSVLAWLPSHDHCDAL